MSSFTFTFLSSILPEESGLCDTQLPAKVKSQQLVNEMGCYLLILVSINKKKYYRNTVNQKKNWRLMKATNHIQHTSYLTILQGPLGHMNSESIQFHFSSEDSIIWRLNDPFSSKDICEQSGTDGYLLPIVKIRNGI